MPALTPTAFNLPLIDPGDYLCTEGLSLHRGVIPIPRGYLCAEGLTLQLGVIPAPRGYLCTEGLSLHRGVISAPGGYPCTWGLSAPGGCCLVGSPTAAIIYSFAALGKFTPQFHRVTIKPRDYRVVFFIQKSSKALSALLLLSTVSTEG